MVESLIRPSFKQGFARGSLSRRPNLWKGLVGCWKPSLGVSGINTLFDVSGRGNHGTLNNMTIDDWVISGGGNRSAGYALNFDGINKHVQISRNSGLDFGANQAFSASFWTKWAGNPSVNQGLMRSQVDTPFWNLERRWSTDLLRFETDAVQIESTTDLKDSAWHHILAWRDSSGNLFLDVDGISEGTPTGTDSTTLVSSTDLFLAQKGDNSAYFGGLIDDLRLYSRALNVAERMDTYKNPNAMFQFRDRVVGRFAAVAGAALLKRPQDNFFNNLITR